MGQFTANHHDYVFVALDTTVVRNNGNGELKGTHTTGMHGERVHFCVPSCIGREL